MFVFISDEQVPHGNAIKEDLSERLLVPEYELGKRHTPPLFPDYEDDESQDLLEQTLKRDLLWSIVQTLATENQEECDEIRPRACTLHEIIFQKSVVEYLPTIPHPPEYDVCKTFRDDINEIMKEIDLEHIFSHADEQLYARLAYIIWKLQKCCYLDGWVSFINCESGRRQYTNYTHV